MLLDDAAQRAGAHALVIALVGQPVDGLRRQVEGDAALGKLASSCMTNFCTTWWITGTGSEPNGMIASRRLRNSGVNSRLIASSSSPSRLDEPKPIGGLRHVGSARIGRHDQDDVAEVDLLAVVVGQLAVIHDLQQDVEQVRMRLLDLVEQQHAMRMLVDAIGQQAALVEADIARRRADQPAETVCRSMYSDMSKRSSSTPSVAASCLATSVLPTPVGPENR